MSGAAVLGLLFALVALFYASIGFGGGSSYLALLVVNVSRWSQRLI